MNDYLEKWHQEVLSTANRIAEEAIEKLNKGESVEDVNLWVHAQEKKRIPVPPPPPGLEYLDDPVTVCPNEYFDRIAKAVYPNQSHRDSVKRIRERVRYAIEKSKKNRITVAGPPFPQDHVYTEVFYRWLIKTYPVLRLADWIHRYYQCEQIAVTCTASWKNGKILCNDSRSINDKKNWEALYQQEKKERERLEKENTQLRQQVTAARRDIEELRVLKNKEMETRRKKSVAGRRGGRGNRCW